MKILFLTLGNRNPSTRFRVLQWIPILEKCGHRIYVQHAWPTLYYISKAFNFKGGRRTYSYIKLFLNLLSRVSALRNLDHYDLIFLQRQLLENDLGFLEKFLFNKARHVIFDFDDAIFLDGLGNNSSRKEAYAKFVFSHADCVIAGNTFLKNYASQYSSRVELVPTCIDTFRYRPYSIQNQKDRHDLIIGWIGTASNLKYLNQLANIFRKLTIRYQQLRLKIISDHQDPILEFNGLPVDYIKWQDNLEIEFIRQFDIGIMPLENNDWSRGKCGLKLIQYLSCGVASVATKIGANLDIIESGKNGFLAQTEADWLKYIERLIEDPQLRIEFANNGRTKVERNYSIEAYKTKFINIIESIG